MKNKGLGKGLNALFEDVSYEVSSVLNEEENINFDESKQVKFVNINLVEPNKNQPRKDFNQEHLRELAASIAVYGVLQPLLVSEIKKESNDIIYLIIAGERRWRASRIAGLSEIPVIIKNLSNQEISEITLIENLQREDLNPLEEAIGYKDLIDKYKLTQEEIASRVGKSRPNITNSMRILNLSSEILELIRNKKLSSAHGRTLLSFPEEKRLEYALLSVKNDWSVRYLEKLSNNIKEDNNKKIILKDSFYNEAEIYLKEHLGNNVKIVQKGDKGKIQIDFTNKEQLNKIIELLSN